MDLINQSILTLSALICWGTILTAFLTHLHFKKVRALKSQGWVYNQGQQPALFNVDIVFTSGKTKWKVPAKEQRWAKTVSNPIKRYRKYQTLDIN